MRLEGPRSCAVIDLGKLYPDLEGAPTRASDIRTSSPDEDHDVISRLDGSDPPERRECCQPDP